VPERLPPSAWEAYTALIRDELARWREVIRAGNIRAD
jgi:hypothetical protein